MKRKAPKVRTENPQDLRRWRTTAESALRWLVAAFFLMLPFVVSVSGSDKFRLPKTVFATSAIVLFGALLVSIKPLPRFRFRLWSWEFWLALALLYSALQSLLVEERGAALTALFYLLHFVALYLILREVAHQEFLQRLWLGLGVVGALHSIMTVLQYRGLFPGIERSDGELVAGRINPAGLIGDVQSGALFFGLVSLVLLFYAMTTRRPWIRWSALGLIATNLVGLVFTRTLTALVAFGLCVLFWLAFHHLWHFRSGLRLTKGLVSLWLLLIAGTAGVVAVAYESGLASRIRVVASQMKNGNWELATAGRQPVYAITWQMIQERPWVGTGLNSFGRDFFQYRTATDYGRQQKLIDQPGAFRQVHNEYLQAWLELGLGGLILYLIVIATPLVSGIKRALRSSDPQESYWMAVLSLGVLFILVESLTFFPFQLTLSGCLIVLMYVGLRPRALSEERRSATEGPALRWGKRAAAAILAAYLIFQGVEEWLANSEIGFAEEMLNVAYSGQAGDLRRQRMAARASLSELDRALGRCSDCYQAHNLRASSLLLLGRYQEAVESYRIAVRHIPSAEVYTNLGVALFQLRRAEEAEESLQTALYYRPDYPQARQALELLKR